jgi:hypothetical protein
MKKAFTFIAIACFTLSFSVGCGTTLRDYQPKTPEEIAIKELLIAWETSWADHNIEKNLALWNDKAQIMTGQERRIVSKTEYAEILPERMKTYPNLKIRSPQIKVAGNKAEVKVNIKVGGYKSSETWHLVKENDVWSIMSWEY